MPFTLGQEGAGTVEAVGPGVSDVRVGQRVAWTGVMGSYATQALVPAARLVAVPDRVSSKTAAAVMLQGMTAHYLTHDTFALRSGHDCLIHAAAGGVGLLFCQMARKLGARVIGTAGSAEKAQLARKAGANEVIEYRTADFEAEGQRRTGRKGVHVVYDSGGQGTSDESRQELRLP